MKWFIYNLLFALAYALMLPGFLLRMARRGGYRARFADRFGRYPEAVRARFGGKCRPYWIHAVSVGEVQVAGQLMRAMRERDPSVRFVFSTTSSTGWKMAERELGENDTLIYNPLDFVPCVRRAFAAVRPRAVILVESEIWPNFIRWAAKTGVPLFLANARMSDRSAPRYRAMRCFFGEIFAGFSRIFAQSPLDAERLVDAGARAEAVEVAGSFKFDVARRNEAKERELAGWMFPDAVRRPVLLGGSTWPGEDEDLMSIYAKLLESRPDAELVIAPRHFEKAGAVEANARRLGFRVVRRSRADAAGSPGRRVFLADTTGELMGLYGLATVAFVGKSLREHGSQNMIEPCLCAVPTLVGPHTENFRPVMSDLLAAGAIVQVKDADELEREILRLFGDAGARKALGERAAQAVASRRGVVGRCAEAILASCAGGEGR